MYVVLCQSLLSLLYKTQTEIKKVFSLAEETFIPFYSRHNNYIQTFRDVGEGGGVFYRGSR